MKTPHQHYLSYKAILIAKGRLSIPESLLNLLGLDPGSTLKIEVVNGGLLLRPVVQSPSRTVWLTATQFRTQLFRLAAQLADGELERVIISRRGSPPVQMVYDGELDDVWSDEEATSLDAA